MYRDICLTNSEAMTHWLDEYIDSLAHLRDHIAAHDRNLSETFADAQQKHLNGRLPENIPD